MTDWFYFAWIIKLLAGVTASGKIVIKMEMLIKKEEKTCVAIIYSPRFC